MKYLIKIESGIVHKENSKRLLKFSDRIYTYDNKNEQEFWEFAIASIIGECNKLKPFMSALLNKSKESYEMVTKVIVSDDSMDNRYQFENRLSMDVVYRLTYTEFLLEIANLTREVNNIVKCENTEDNKNISTSFNVKVEYKGNNNTIELLNKNFICESDFTDTFWDSIFDELLQGIKDRKDFLKYLLEDKLYSGSLVMEIVETGSVPLIAFNGTCSSNILEKVNRYDLITSFADIISDLNNVLKG